MPEPKVNLVDILDRLIALYGPTFAALYKEHPEACGIAGFIDRADPTALPKDEDGRGYGDDEFEEKARAAMKLLVAETCEIAATLKIKGKYPPQFHVDLDLRDDGKVYLEAMVADGLGAVVAKRRAIVFENHGFNFFCTPAQIAVMAFSEHEAEIRNVMHAAKAGLDEAVEFMIEADLVHNQKGKNAQIARKFLNLFPTDGKTHISKVVKQAIWVSAESTQQPYKLMVTAAAREELEGRNFVGAEFQTLDASEPASRMRH
ncbi:hypothetical protein D3C71_338920 [compost metagenome]